jgi:hypothetical protein
MIRANTLYYDMVYHCVGLLIYVLWKWPHVSFSMYFAVLGPR